MIFNKRSIAALLSAVTLVVVCHSQVAAPASLPPCLIQYSSGSSNPRSSSRLVLYYSGQTYTVINWIFSNSGTITTQAPVSGSFTYTVDLQNSSHATIAYEGGALPNDELYFSVTDSGSQYPPNSILPFSGYANFSLYPNQITSGGINVSNRANLAAAGYGITGFVIASGGPRWVLVRGVGKSLGKYGVPSGVSIPTFTLYDSTQTVVGTSSVWSSDPNLISGYNTIFLLLGAFPLNSGSDEGVLLVPLIPGAYTVIYNAGIPGTMLCEVYILPF